MALPIAKPPNVSQYVRVVSLRDVQSAGCLPVQLDRHSMALYFSNGAVYAVDRYSTGVQSTAAQRLAPTPDAAVTSVDFTSPSDVRIYVRHTGDLPSYADLLKRLHGVIPDGIAVHVDASVGSETEVGKVGAS